MSDAMTTTTEIGSGLVLIERPEPGIVVVLMNRPDKRNALSLDLIKALDEAITQVASDDEARVLILGGTGKSFCAGMDLRGVLDDAALMAGMLERLSIASRRLRRLSIPTIARVQGAAVGGGCGLMVVPDFALTHAESRVGYPEVSLGVCPAVVAPWLMKKIGAGPARTMLLGGGTVTGAEGHAMGLSTHLVERDDLDDAALELARELAKGGKEALAVTKRWVNELDGSMEDAPFERAWKLSAEVIAGEEAQRRLGELFGG